MGVVVEDEGVISEVVADVREPGRLRRSLGMMRELEARGGGGGDEEGQVARLDRTRARRIVVGMWVAWKESKGSGVGDEGLTSWRSG